ncbi:MAG: amino acid adenylation domain-containing protein, partial [Planctomyces sp.]|nr:amino acid adenylation domain-containing protein [Planctomyces sp.]
LPGKQIGIRDHFFEIGGHSLLAVVLTSRLSKLLKTAIPVRLVFENPTIELLERAIQSDQLLDRPRQSLISPTRLTDRQSSPASFAQQRFWFLHHVLQNPETYNVPAAWLFRNTNNQELPSSSRIRAALQILMNRHEILRTSLQQTDSGIVQKISCSAELSVPFTEHIASFEQAQLLVTLNQLTQIPFDLSDAPLWRTHLLTDNSANACILLNFHHCIIDDWSIRILSEELSALLTTPEGDKTSFKTESEGSETLQYLDFAAWEAENLNSGHLNFVQDYWRNRLSGVSPELGLPTDAVRPTKVSDAGSVLHKDVSESLIERLRVIAAAENSTLFGVLMASWATVLTRYANQSDILIGVPFALRNHSEFSRSVGFFLNTVPVRVQVQDQLSFREFLSQLQLQIMDDFEHAVLPLEQIIQLAENLRTASANSPLRTMLVVTEEVPPELTTEAGTGTWVRIDSAFSRSEVTLRLLRSQTGWYTELEYSTDLFDKESIELLQQHLQQFLENVARNPEQTLQEIDFVPTPEKNRLLTEWNRTGEDFPEQLCLHQLFEMQATRSPNQIAVEDTATSLTYSQLSLLSDRIAAELIQHGVTNEDIVLICTRRSTATIAGLLGIMKSGGAWLPLDPDMPMSRMNRIVDSARPKVILTNTNLVSQFDAGSVRVITIEDLKTDINSMVSAATTLVSCTPESTAYVIYTSGSTGEPKGVMISHRNLVNYSTGIVRTLGLESGMRFATVSTLAADLAFTVVFPTLISGGELHVLSREQTLSATEMAEYFLKNQIDVVKMVPSHLKSMLETSEPRQREHLIPGRILVLGGELLQSSLVRMVQSVAPHCRIFNHYGPTETTVGVLANEVSCLDPVHFRRDTMPLGYPLQNCQVYVVDSANHPAGIGVPGEIVIGGDSVGHGYLRSDSLTRERFIPDSLLSQTHPGSRSEKVNRLYRTGDRGRVLPDGRIEFLGRVDHQVKVRGFRVELGEIDSALRQLPRLSDGVAQIQPMANGDSELVAYVVAQPVPGTDVTSPHEELNASEIRTQLGRLIPDYMIPVRFIALPELPLNLNGKIDRERLVSVAGRELGIQSESRAPQCGLESEIAKIWIRLLQRDSVGANDNFFEIGGHSLMSVRLVYALREQLGRAVAISDIFEYPTIEDMAKHLDDQDHSRRKWTSIVPLQPKGSKPPLFCIHGWGGAVFGFIELAKHFGPERPVYGVQAIGLEREVPRHTSIEEMAAHYVSEIRMIQPHGPYNLTGYSMGGWIAFAVAQELVAQGETVGFLGLLDTHTSANVGWRIFLKTMWRPLILRAVQQLKQARRLPVSQLGQFFLGRFRSLVQRLPGVKRRHTSQEPDAAVESAEIGSSGDARSDYFFTVVGQYQPKVFNGNAAILVTGEFSQFPYEQFWRNFITGTIQIHQVQGGHDRMIAGEFAAPAAALLESLITETES